MECSSESDNNSSEKNRRKNITDILEGEDIDCLICKLSCVIKL